MSESTPIVCVDPSAQNEVQAKPRFRLGTYGLLAACFWLAGVWFLLSGASLYSSARRLESGRADAAEIARSAGRMGFGDAFIGPGADYFAERARQRLALGIRANARSSTVFGLFCIITGGFWFGFGRLDPAITGRCGG